MYPLIDTSTCTGCGLCVDLCGYSVLALEGAPVKATVSQGAPCIECGHCVAVCPTGSVRHPSLGPARRRKELADLPSPESLDALLALKRSTRRYSSRPLDDSLVDRLAQAAATAPSGCNARPVHLTVVTNPDRLERIEQLGKRLMVTMAKVGTLPGVSTLLGHIPVAAIKRLADPHLLAGARPIAQGAKDDLPFVTLGAPALFVFHGPASAPTPEADGVIAAYHVVMMAEALGLGTCLNGNLVELLAVPSLARLVDLPGDHAVMMVVSVGWPAVTFGRTAPRRPLEVRRVR